MVREATNEAEVYFALCGDDFDPDDATVAIKLEPSSVGRKGRQKNGAILRESVWMVSSGSIKGEFVNVYDISSELISKLAPYVEEIVLIRATLKLGAVLKVVLTISTDEAKSTPAVGFDSSVLDFLHRVGGSIDVDIYKSAH